MPINHLLRNYLVQKESLVCREFKSLANAVTVQNDQYMNQTVDSVELSEAAQGKSFASAADKLESSFKSGEVRGGLAGSLKPGEFMGGSLKPGEFMGGALKPGEFIAGTLVPGGFMAGGVMGFMSGGSPRS